MPKDLQDATGCKHFVAVSSTFRILGFCTPGISRDAQAGAMHAP